MKSLSFGVLTLCLLLISSASIAATAITKDVANAYYQNCLAQDTPMMGTDSKDMMCSCTASKMMETMSVEDVQLMSSETDEARAAVNKMLLSVYAPCIEFPARDYHYLTCMESPDTKQITSKPQALCACMSDEVATFLGANAVEVFTDILKRTPRIFDPMDALTNDKQFKEFAHSRLLGCYAKNR